MVKKYSHFSENAVRVEEVKFARAKLLSDESPFAKDVARS
jgi:hypothetical protein